MGGHVTMNMMRQIEGKFKPDRKIPKSSLSREKYRRRILKTEENTRRFDGT